MANAKGSSITLLVEPTVEPPGPDKGGGNSGKSVESNGNPESGNGKDDDDDIRKITIDRLRLMEQETVKLRTENTILHGKIRGYETLGQLLIEAKQECAKYRRQNDELHEKLTAVGSLHYKQNTSLGSPNQPFPEKISVEASEPSHQPLIDFYDTKISDLKQEIVTTPPPSLSRDMVTSVTSHRKVATESVEQTDAQVEDDMKQLSYDHRDAESNNVSIDKYMAESKTPRSPLLMSLGSTSGKESSGDSDRYGMLSPGSGYVGLDVEINGLGKPDAFSLGSFSIGNVTSGSSLPMPILPSRPQTNIATESSTSHLVTEGGSHVEQESELSVQMNYLQKVLDQQHDTDTDLSTQCARLMFEMRKQEKTIHMNKTMVNSLTSENEHLKHRCEDVISEKNRKISELEERIKKLLEKIRQRERERDKMSSPENPVGWVTVETMQQKDDEGEIVVGTEVTENEIALRKKVMKLQNNVDELMSVNKKWDEHCTQLKTDHENQMAKMKQELAHIKKQDETRQKDIDRMLLSTKKRLEEMEMDKEAALQDLHMEKNHRSQNDRELEEEQEHSKSLQLQLTELENEMETVKQQKQAIEAELVVVRDERNRSPLQMFAQPHMYPSQYMAPSPPTAAYPPAISGAYAPVGHTPAGPDAQAEVLVLRQQIAIFKEDFDNERKDRERAQHEKGKLNTQLEKIKEEASTAKQQVKKLKENLQKERQEKNIAKQNLQKQFAQVQQAAYTAVPQYPVQQPQAAYHLQATSTMNPPQYGYNVAYPQPTMPVTTQIYQNQQAKWSCNQCTYENVGARTFCEACGTKKGLGFTNTQVPTPVQHMQEQEFNRQRPSRLIPRSGTEFEGRHVQSQYPQYTMSSNNLVIDGSHSAAEGLTSQSQYPQYTGKLPSDDLVTDSGD